jgi:hypothetical protein
MRHPRNKRYKVKAYYIDSTDREFVFWCKEKKIKNITNELGQSMPMANGERVLETDSTLDFQMNDKVRIGGETVLIQDFDSNTDDKDLNAMRGKPRNIKTILVR